MKLSRKFIFWLFILCVVQANGDTSNTGVESADKVLTKEARESLLKSSFDSRLAFLQDRRAQIMATPPPDPEREPFATRVVSFDDLKAIEWSVLFSLREFPEKADLALQEMAEWLPFRWTIEMDGMRGGRDGALTPVPGWFSSYGEKGRDKLIEVFDESPDEGVRRLAFQMLSRWGRSQGHVEPWLQALWDRTQNVDELLEPAMSVVFDQQGAKEGRAPFRETIKKQVEERDTNLMAQATTESNNLESTTINSTSQISAKQTGEMPEVSNDKPTPTLSQIVMFLVVLSATGVLILLVKMRA